MAVVKEITHLNAQIRLYLGNGLKLTPIIEPYTKENLLHAWNKVIFGNGSGPSPLPGAERYVVIKLDQTRVTKEEARKMVLQIIDTAATALTLRPPNDRPSEIDRYETHLTQWLYNSEPTEEPSPVERVSGPLLISQPTAPSAATFNAALPAPATYVSNVASTSQPLRSHRQSFPTQYAGEHTATYVSNTPAGLAPQPQWNQQPVFLPTALPHQQQAPAPPLTYHPQGPPMYWNTHQQGPLIQHPFHPHFTHHGPFFGAPLLLPPLPMQVPMQQPIVVVQSNPPVNSRSSLPPARRQASQSVWAPGRGQFNVAEWAQEHRPRTPTSSRNAAAPPGTINATAPVQNVPIRYGPNVDIMYPRGTGQPSEQLRSLTNIQTPGFTALTDGSTFPFEVPATNTGPATGGVIRISNTPYGLTRADIASFLGQHTAFATAKAAASIHIIMDRMTGKTYDCYVEIQSTQSAQAIVNLRNSLGNTQPLLDRNPIVAMSSLDQLLGDMFPKARVMQWANGQPSLRPGELIDSPFKALVTHEEMTTTVRYAESPQRTQFIGQKCPQRVYEFMISTLAKFPWYATNAYTMGTRNHIFAAVRDLLRILLNQSDSGRNADLNEALLSELLYAGLNCPGFSERQRWELTRACGVVGGAARVSPLAKDWPFMVLGRKPNVPEDVMEFYIDRLTKHLDIKTAKPTMNPFRSFLLPPNRGEASLAGEMGSLELQGVLDIYKMTLAA